MIDRNENRPGYKKTKVGWIPEEWETANLGNVADVLFSNVDKKTKSDENHVLLCNYMDVYYKKYITSAIDFMQATASNNEITRFGLRRGDVIITKDSETQNDIAVSAIVCEEIPNLICGYHLAIIRAKDYVLFSDYLNKLFDLHTIRHYFATLANGVTRFGLSFNAVNNALIPLPPLTEQKKIAEVLSTWDEAIEQTRRLIDAKERRKKALMQQIFTEEKVDKQYLGKRIVMAMGELIEPIARPVSKPKGAYRSIGIRSHGKGTFRKIVEQPEKVMMDTLYRVESDDLILNITFAWEGAIAIVSERDAGGFVSHRFPTYRFKKGRANIEYFRQVILTRRFVWDLGLISPGGAGRNRVLSKKDFLNLRVNVPTYEKQEVIGKALTTVDDEIDLLRERLNALEKQKRGLMQKLLTGGIRVKT